MDDSQKFFNDFRKNTLKPNEEESFAIIAGDFNFDNISPGTYVLTFKVLHFVKVNAA